MLGALSACGERTNGSLIYMKPKQKLIRPTDAEDAAITAAAMSDPDAIPFTDEEWEQIKPLVRRGPGRPLGSGTKSQITLRIDKEVLEKFKAMGTGWQTRMNDVLRQWARRH
jgi:uncharacterized protein (DUF4415 family)